MDEVFSAIVRMKTLRFLLGEFALEELELLQVDVKMTIIHGDLNEEIYVKQPQSFASSGHEDLVCWLRKSIYRVKHALRQW